MLQQRCYQVCDTYVRHLFMIRASEHINYIYFGWMLQDQMGRRKTSERSLGDVRMGQN